MDADQFVRGIKIAVYDTSVKAVMKSLAQPPGRRPHPGLVALSEWFNQQDADDQSAVRNVVRLAVDHAVFGMLAALDGVRSLDDEHSALTLISDGVLINDPREALLHDRFRAEVDTD